jgi:hypothetical protein
MARNNFNRSKPYKTHNPCSMNAFKTRRPFGSILSLPELFAFITNPKEALNNPQPIAVAVS